MERKFREEWDYVGTPIQLWFIDRDLDQPERIRKAKPRAEKHEES